jgi:integrase
MQVWKIEPTSVLTRRELAAVVAHLRVRARRSPNAGLNLVLVRLACCAGLRASEIGGLQIGDVHVGERPHLRIRAETAKGGQKRRVPLGGIGARWKTCEIGKPSESGKVPGRASRFCAR